MAREAAEAVSFAVTDVCCQAILVALCPCMCLPLIPGVMGRKRLVLEAEEALMVYDGCLCRGSSRRPYGELGSVDVVRCCCFSGFSSSITPLGGSGFPPLEALCPGSGCDDAAVEEIVAELRARVKRRGDEGQIKETEAVGRDVLALRADVAALSRDVRAIMEHLRVAPPELQVME